MYLYDGMQLIINENFSHMSIEIYGRVIMGNRLLIIGFDGERLIEQEVTRENELMPLKEFKPLLIVGRFMFESLLKAFVEYANNKGMKTENENLLQGKLNATETHLTDMRELSKKLVEALIKIK
jgi:hypothetical protein